MEATKLNIYSGREKLFNKELEKIMTEDISPRNKELITSFQNYLFAKSSGEIRVSKLSSQMRAIIRYMNNALNIHKNLDELNKTDLINLVSFINRINRKEATKADYRRTIKQFFNWFKDDDLRFFSKDEIIRNEVHNFYKYLEKEVHTSYKKTQIDPSTVLTEEDINKVIDVGCKGFRDKAFISLLHESGMRATEFLSLKLKDISFKQDIAEVQVPDGKTGTRRILIYRAIPYIQRYLEIHPFKNDLNSYLWLSEARTCLNQTLQHKGAQKIIDRCFKRAELIKRHNFHWFRHSRASILAPKITETMLCKFMGWSIGSRQVKTYVHLCTKQLEDVFLSINGLQKEDTKQDTPLKCSICGTLNPSNERYCYKCSRPLKIETIIQDQELIKTETAETIKTLMFELMKDPDLLNKIKEMNKK